MAGQVGFFDLEDRLASLSAAGDPLERLSSTVDFEIFRPALKRALRRSDRSKGGRPPCDAVVMFRILVLQALHGLSDAQAEHRVRDRLSFMRLPGLGLGERIPDERTIRLSCERLVRAGAMDRLFDRFGVELENRGYLAMSGRILDASLVAAPRQRNSDAEKAAIKDGRIPEYWTTRPARLRQKDRDARWRMKNRIVLENDCLPGNLKHRIDALVDHCNHQTTAWIFVVNPPRERPMQPHRPLVPFAPCW